MGSKFTDRFPGYNDLRLKTRISHSLTELVEKLETVLNEDRKIVYLQKLFQSDLTEILPSQLKIKLFDVIQQDLNNFGSEVFEISFNLHLKLMKSIPSEYSKYCFKNVVHTLIFLTELQQHNKLKKDLDDAVVLRLLYLTKFALQIFYFILSNKTSFSDENLIEIFEHFITLLSKRTNNDALTPFDIVCNVDQVSKWSNDAVNSQRLRFLFLNCLKNRPGFLKLLITIVKDWFHTPTVPILNADITFSTMDKNAINFHNFISSFCTIVNICKFHYSSRIFPIVIKENSIDLFFFLKTTFEFLKQTKYMHSLPPKVTIFIAKILGTIFNNPQCVDKAMLDYMFQDINLWMPSLIILLTAIVKYETSALIFLEELSDRRLTSEQLIENESESLKPHTNNLAKHLCKLISSATNNVIRGEENDQDLAVYLVKIFDNIFSNNYFCHILIQEDPKLLPHLLHFSQNIKYTSENSCAQQTCILRCLQRIFTMIAFSPHCLEMLKDDSLVQRILSYADSRSLKWKQSWKLTFFIFTSLLKKSSIYISERNLTIQKTFNSYINLLEYETCSDIDEAEKDVLNLIYIFTHEANGLNAVLDVPDTESEETITDSIEDFPLSVTEFINMTLESEHFDSKMQLMGLKMIRNITSSLDSSISLQNHLNINSRIQEFYTFLGQNDCKELFYVTENILQTLYLKCPFEIPVNINNFNLSDVIPTETKIKEEQMNYLFQVIAGPSNINIVGDAFEKLLLKISPESSDILSSLFLSADLNWLEIEDDQISPDDQIGIELTIRFGKMNNVIEDSPDKINDLKMLQKFAKKALICNQEEYVGHNWFAATIYLLNGGNLEITKNCLNLLMRFENVSYFLAEMGSSTDWAFLDYIISKELPTLCFDLQNHGICPWVLSQKWTKESFWKILCWDELKKILIFLLLHTSEYLFYFHLTFLRRNETKIRQQVHERNFLFMPEKLDYKLSDHILEFDVLKKKYNGIFQEMISSG